MRIHRIVSIAAVTFALLGHGTASAQTDEEKAAARALAMQGAEALQNKKYAEAVDYLSRAEAVVHAPTHLLLIGRAQVGLGKLVAARENFLKITREQLAANAPAPFKKAQQDAKDELAAIEPRIASLQIALAGPGAADPSKVTVKLDEQPVTSALIGVHRPIDPGKHMVSATVAGRDPVTQEVSLGDGEKKEISLEVQAPAEAAAGAGTGQTPGGDQKTPDKPAGMGTLRIVGIGGMGLGAAGLVAGGVFTGLYVSKQGEADEAFADCGGVCPPDAQEKIKDLDNAAASRGTVAIVGLTAGAVLLGGGIALFIVGGKKADKPAAAMVLPYVTPSGLGVVGQF